MEDKVRKKSARSLSTMHAMKQPHTILLKNTSKKMATTVAYGNKRLSKQDIIITSSEFNFLC